MVAWTHLQRFSAVAAGATSGLAVYFYQTLRDNKVYNSWTNSELPVPENAKWNFNWDFRDPKSMVKPPSRNSTFSSVQEENRYNESLEACRPKATRHILLVRHGEYLDYGEHDIDHRLTALGRKQAKYTGERLKALGFNFDRVIASTMTRAQETAKIILGEIGIEESKMENCSLIREGAPIPPQPPVGHWKPEASFFRDSARIEAGFRRYFHRADAEQKHDSYTLIVGHGNVIRYFFCRILQFPPEAWLRLSINHASITHITIAPSGRVSVKTLGDSGHIPAEYLTYKIPKAKNVV